MKNILLLLLLLKPLLFGMQAFNLQTVAVERVTQGASKTFFGTTTVPDGSVKEIVLRYDAFVEALHVSDTFTPISLGQPLARLYAPEVYTAQVELVHALCLGSASLIQSATQKLVLLGVPEQEIARVLHEKTPAKTFTLPSSFQGTITQKNINAGSFIPAGTPLYEVSDYATLWITLTVYERDIAFANHAKTAEVVFDMDPTRTYPATLERILPRIDPQTKSVQVRLSLPNPQGAIFENAFAKVRLSTPERSYLALPATAVLTKGQRHFVFKKGEFEGEYDPTPIQAKRLNNGTFEILSGLKEGEEVAANGLFMLDSDVQNFGGISPW